MDSNSEEMDIEPMATIETDIEPTLAMETDIELEATIETDIDVEATIEKQGIKVGTDKPLRTTLTRSSWSSLNEYISIDLKLSDLGRKQPPAPQEDTTLTTLTNSLKHASIDMDDNALATVALNRVIRKEDFSRFKVIGQFNLGFILALLEDDLFIIDQHAADEKYNFETLQATTRLNGQQLLK